MEPDPDMKYITESKANGQNKSRFKSSQYITGSFLVIFSKYYKIKEKSFSYYNDNESKAEALIEAKKYRNKVCAKLCFPNKTDRIFKSQISKYKTSDLPLGIYRLPSKSGGVIQCSWCPKSRITKTKSFSIKKYGEEEAIQMAIKYRSERLHEIHSKSETCIIPTLP